LLPVLTWKFQPACGAGNHDAGSGRPVTSQEAAMPNYNQAHAFYAGVDLHARSRLVHGPRAGDRSIHERT